MLERRIRSTKNAIWASSSSRSNFESVIAPAAAEGVTDSEKAELAPPPRLARGIVLRGKVEDPTLLPRLIELLFRKEEEEEEEDVLPPTAFSRSTSASAS